MGLRARRQGAEVGDDGGEVGVGQAGIPSETHGRSETGPVSTRPVGADVTAHLVVGQQSPIPDTGCEVMFGEIEPRQVSGNPLTMAGPNFFPPRPSDPT